MPCSSIATVSAQISQKLMQELLKNQLAQQALANWAKQEFPGVQIKGFSFYFPDRTSVTISSQRIIVSGRSKNLSQIRDKIKEFIENLGGILVQQRIETALKNKYQVTESTMTRNGALVLKVRI